MLIKLSDTKFVACSSIDELNIDYDNNKIEIILTNNRIIKISHLPQMSLTETFDYIRKQIDGDN
jgi:hypothetical protein